MLGEKPTRPRGASDNLLELALSVQKIFNREIKAPSSVRSPAKMTLSDLPDEKCPQCARHFEPTHGLQIYCSNGCAKKASFLEHNGWRGAAREALKCTRCGKPIADIAKRRDKKLCAACKHANRLEICRQHRLRAKASESGRRGTNQFGRKEPAAKARGESACPPFKQIQNRT